MVVIDNERIQEMRERLQHVPSDNSRYAETIFLLKQLEQRDKTIAELRELLKRCEWSAEVSGHWEEAGCPICGNNESFGHDVECELGKAITASM